MSPTKKFWSLSILSFVWAAALSVLMASLLAEHMISFKPYIFKAAGSSETGISMTHVLGAGCKCSKIVAQYLRNRKSLGYATEAVILIGDEPETEALLAEFPVHKVQANEIDSELIVGVPYLIIRNAKDDILYSGGYSKSHIFPSTKLLDVEILNSLIGQGPTPSNLPVFGCATSMKYKNILDPFKIKYREAHSENL